MALTIPVAEIVESSKKPLLGKHDSWGRVLLGDIATIQNGFPFKSSQFTRDEGMPLIRIRDVGSDGSDTNYVGDYDPAFIVKAGDLLIGMDGDFNCARWRGPDGLLNQRVCRVILKSDIYHPKLLDYALPGYLKAINDMTSSVTVKHLSSKSIAEIPLPLPPMDQQKRIVAEIEKQFSRLDEAVANLKRVKANLKRYKSAVLKAAVAGVERAWPESQLADVCQIVSGFAFKSVDFCASGIPAIKIANVGYGEFLWKDQEYLPLSFHSKYQSFVVRPGDLLLALTRPITNGTVKVCRYPNDAPVALLNQRVAVLRPTEKAKPEFLLSLLQSEIFKAQLNDALSETLQPNLSPVDLKKFSVRLPGVHEQMHIIDEIDRRLSVLRETESQVGSNHQRAERLRQSILGRAFNAIANTYL